jgi:hypothetical protein
VIDEMLGVQTGRHALDEDAFQTPIFHALSRGGRKRHQQEGTTASLEEFRRDPLTAPIPIQALAPMPSIRERLQAAGRRDRGVESSGRRDRQASAPRDWAGLTALAERGRHRLATSNW